MISHLMRTCIRWAYRHIIKPLLFRTSPDIVHKRLTKLTRIVGGLAPARWLLGLMRYEHRDMLGQEIAGITFVNPVGLSAGFDKTCEMLPVMKAVGFGYMIAGSVTHGKYEGNKGPWFHRLPEQKSLVVNAGLPSAGSEKISEHLAKYAPEQYRDFPQSLSVAKTNSADTASTKQGVKDYVQGIAANWRQPSVAMIEINISCPNTYGGEPFTTPGRLEKLLAVVDELRLSKPVFIKMPINLAQRDYLALLDVVVKHNVEGVTVGNLMKDRSAMDISKDIKGNLSGKPAAAITTELVRLTYRTYGDRLTIIGVGGIFSAHDAYEKIRAGATLVALITGMIFEGPQLPADINAGLVKLLRADGFTHVSQAIGIDAKNGV